MLKLPRLALIVATGLIALVGSLLVPQSAVADDPMTASISGTVLLLGSDGTTKTPAQFEVGTAAVYWSPSIGTSEPNPQTFTKGANGGYTISGLAAGRYTVLMRTGAGGYPSEYLGGAKSAITAEYFDVCAGCQVTGKDFLIVPGGGFSGTMTDTSGNPVRGTVVIYQGGTTDQGDSLIGTSSVHSDGTFSGSGFLPVGTYKLGFTDDPIGVTRTGSLAPGVSLHNQWYEARNSYSEAFTISITQPGEVITGINPVMHYAAIDPTSTVVGASEYVALGDSYQSGEGAHSYYPTTDQASNYCHRSQVAYPELLASTPIVAAGALKFWACSGSLIGDLSVGSVKTTQPYDDPQRSTSESNPSDSNPGTSALGRLSASTRLVTVGIGGNDMQFASTLHDCVTAVAGPSCEAKDGAALATRLQGMIDSHAWEALFDDIRRRAPNARILALGYPHFYPLDGREFCLGAGVRLSDEIWINYLIRQVGNAIEAAAAAEDVQFVDDYDTSDGLELCTSGDQFFNGIDLGDGHGGGSPFINPESYHPTALGHSLIAAQVESALGYQAPGVTFTMQQGETDQVVQSVPEGTIEASFETNWPGSIVTTTLISPSGRPINGSTVAPDVQHASSPTSERFEITNPESGNWTMRIYGNQLAAGGEQVTASSASRARPNLAPTAALAVTATDSSVHVDGSASNDPDGTIVSYLWDFGDGSTATGSSADHTYTTPGTYRVTLVVTDNKGDKGFADAANTVTVGDQLALSSGAKGSTHRAIYSENSDGTRVARLTDGSSVDSSPSWSPDGSKIVFSSFRGGLQHIYVMNSDGTAVTRLTSGLAVDSTPTWSPDGTKIAFASLLRSGLSSIFTMNPDGSGLTRVTHGIAFDDSPTWSPDGTKIAFSSGLSIFSQHIDVINVDGTNKTALTSGLSADSSPSWSPDGSQILFASTRTGFGDIYVMNATGTGLTRLTNDDDPESTPAWSRTGARVSFTSYKQGNADVYLMDADGTNVSRLTTGAGFDGDAAWK